MTFGAPFGWWYSGRFWYCMIEKYGRKFSCAGKTKPQAVGDAMKDARRYARNRLGNHVGAQRSE